MIPSRVHGTEPSDRRSVRCRRVRKKIKPRRMEISLSFSFLCWFVTVIQNTLFRSPRRPVNSLVWTFLNGPRSSSIEPRERVAIYHVRPRPFSTVQLRSPPIPVLIRTSTIIIFSTLYSPFFGRMPGSSLVPSPPRKGAWACAIRIGAKLTRYTRSKIIASISTQLGIGFLLGW